MPKLYLFYLCYKTGHTEYLATEVDDNRILEDYSSKNIDDLVNLMTKDGYIAYKITCDHCDKDGSRRILWMD